MYVFETLLDLYDSYLEHRHPSLIVYLFNLVN